MVVNDLHLLWSSFGPHEADTPLVIDPDAVLPGSVALQRLEPVSRRNAEIVKHLRGSHLTKLPQCNRMNPRIDRPHAFASPQSLGVLVAERPDHGTMI